MYWPFEIRILTILAALACLFPPNVTLRADEPVSGNSVQDESSDPDAAAPEELLLRYRFRPGQFVHYEVESESTLVLQAREEKQTISEKRRTRKHYRVVSVSEDGSAVLEPVIDHVLMEARSDDQEPIVFDSDSSEPVPTQFNTISESIGHVLVRVRYSPLGEVDEVIRVSGRTPSAKNDSETHQFLIAFPEHPVSIGQTWDDDFSVRVSVPGEFKKPLYRPVTIRRRYRLESVEGDTARISFTTYPLSADRDPQIRMQLVQQSLTGQVEFDLKRGVIRKWTSAGTGQVFNPFGPGSSAQASSSNVERLVTSSRPRRRGPIGPQLPGAAGPPAAPGAGD